jgi:hypothetical protein
MSTVGAVPVYEIINIYLYITPPTLPRFTRPGATAEGAFTVPVLMPAISIAHDSSIKKVSKNAIKKRILLDITVY